VGSGPYEREHPQGSWVRVRLDPACNDPERRHHHPSEDQTRGLVTTTGKPGAHSVYILFKGGGTDVPTPPSGLGIGRYFRPDELEPIPKPE
jgi:hypothetical protein